MSCTSQQGTDSDAYQSEKGIDDGDTELIYLKLLNPNLEDSLSLSNMASVLAIEHKNPCDYPFSSVILQQIAGKNRSAFLNNLQQLERNYSELITSSCVFPIDSFLSKKVVLNGIVNHDGVKEVSIKWNTLIYLHELMLAQGFNWKDDLNKAEVYFEKANRRLSSMEEVLWNDSISSYTNLSFPRGSRIETTFSDSFIPLSFGIASRKHGRAQILARMENDLFPNKLLSGNAADYYIVSSLFNYKFFQEGLTLMDYWMSVHDANSDREDEFQADNGVKEYFSLIDQRRKELIH